MRISTSHIFNQNLSSMLNQQTELSRTQQQLSTGKRILNPSDDPAGSVEILNLQREFNLSEQSLANADKAENKLAIEEGTLQSVTTIMQRIRELAVQGLNDSNSQTDRAALAQEVKQLNEQLLGLSNTRDASGNYIFSGFKNDTQPYTSIGANYSGDSGQRNMQVGSGVLIETNDPGNAVFEAGLISTTITAAGTGTGALAITSNSNVAETFSAISFTFSAGPPEQYQIDDGSNPPVTIDYTDGMSVDLSTLNPDFPSIELTLSGAPADTDVITVEKTVTAASQTIFKTINDFANALSSNAVGANDSPNNGDFLTNISTAMEIVGNAQSKIGGRMNAIDHQREIGEGISFNMKKALSSIQDLDYAEAISRLTQQTTGLQAAQQSFARVQNLSLFNYL